MVPSNCWVQGRNLAAKTIENETISLGFVRYGLIVCIERYNNALILFLCRVLPELNIANLRLEIDAQLDQPGLADDDDDDNHVPKNFIFIRNVGRHFAMVSTSYFISCQLGTWN